MSPFFSAAILERFKDQSISKHNDPRIPGKFKKCFVYSYDLCGLWGFEDYFPVDLKMTIFGIRFGFSDKSLYLAIMEFCIRKFNYYVLWNVEIAL